MNGKLRVFPLQLGEPGERFHACLQGAVMRSGIDDIAVNQRIHGKDGVAALPRILEKPGPERVDIRRLFFEAHPADGRFHQSDVLCHACQKRGEFIITGTFVQRNIQYPIHKSTLSGISPLHPLP